MEEKITSEELSNLELAVVSRLRVLRPYEKIEIKHAGDAIVVDHKLSVYERFPLDVLSKK